MNPSRTSQLSPVAGWVLVCALLNATGWLLSAMGRLDGLGYGVVLILAVAGTGWWWQRARPEFRTGFRKRRFKQAFPLAFAVMAALAVAGGILHAPSNYDALAYRTPRILHWLAERQWHWIHTDFQRLNTRGCGIEWVTAPLLLLTGSDRFFFLINAVSFLLLPGLCYRVLTGLGVQRKVAWHWMWVLPAGYCYVLQAGSIANDLFGATLTLAAVDFALRAARERSATAAWLAILAAALMTAGKGFNLLLLLPWGLALLPATGTLLRRPLATLGVGVLALLISLVPTALLNARYCGDWKGLKAEAVNLSTGEPVFHLGVNSALVILQNLNPTFNPLTGVLNGQINRAIPADLKLKLEQHFEGGGAPFNFAEMEMEERAGLGFGVSLLLIPVLLSRIRPRWLARNEWLAALMSPAWLVPASAWLVTLYFFTQAGLGCPARYLAPSYVLLVAPLLRLPRAGELIGRRWWRGLAYLGFALAALLLIATPPRPLWPARTLLRAMHADTSTSSLLRRVWTVYSVYGARADGFSPVRAILPPEVKVLGLVTFDDPETSLWRPFGPRRIVHVTLGDDAQSLRRQGIEQVLVSEYIVTNHQNLTLPEWLARFDSEVVTSLDLTLRATRGSSRWHLVRLRPSKGAE
ncbi:MAG: hypothetical protein V4819_21885 [Verrucomicrobiota bacterium]